MEAGKPVSQPNINHSVIELPPASPIAHTSPSQITTHSLNHREQEMHLSGAQPLPNATREVLQGQTVDSREERGRQISLNLCKCLHNHQGRGGGLRLANSALGASVVMVRPLDYAVDMTARNFGLQRSELDQSNPLPSLTPPHHGTHH